MDKFNPFLNLKHGSNSEPSKSIKTIVQSESSNRDRFLFNNLSHGLYSNSIDEEDELDSIEIEIGEQERKEDDSLIDY